MSKQNHESPDEPTSLTPPPKRISRRKRRLFRWVAIGIPLVVGLSIIMLLLVHREILVVDSETGWLAFQRPPIYLEEPGHERTGHRYRYDASLGWRNIPNWEATTRLRQLQINSKGLRDREYAYKKPTGVRRILVLGDSFAWGYGVSDEEIFTEQLEQRLEQWQVLNTGVSGWGTDQEYLFLKDEGVKYLSDVVVLAFFLFNDPENNTHSVQYGLSKPLFLNTELELTNVPVPPPTVPKVPIQSNADPIELTAAIIAQIAALCTDNDCRFVLMKFGKFLEIEQDRLTKWEQDLIERLGPLDNLLYLDLDAEFKERDITRSDLLHGNNDGHWNAFGHHITALILQDFLKEQQLLDK